MRVVIDGSTLDTLFDTGAHTRLSATVGQIGGVGAFGGNAVGGYRLIVDYPAAELHLDDAGNGARQHDH